MKKVTFILTIVLINFLYIRCNLNSTYLNEESEKIKAEKVTEKLYNYIDKKDYTNLKSLFSENFFKITNEEMLNHIIRKTNDDLGEYQTKKLIKWETKRTVGDNPSSQYLLIYDVAYKKFNARETITLVKEEDTEIKIIGYNVNSEGFLDNKSN